MSDQQTSRACLASICRRPFAANTVSNLVWKIVMVQYAYLVVLLVGLLGDLAVVLVAHASLVCGHVDTLDGIVSRALRSLGVDRILPLLMYWSSLPAEPLVPLVPVLEPPLEPPFALDAMSLSLSMLLSVCVLCDEE